MDVVVSDTNIFIDLMSVGLLETIGGLPLNIHTVDYVVEEIRDDKQREAIIRLKESGQIYVKSFDEVESESIIKMYLSRSNNVSVTDCSVWYYAKKNGYRLLTGDKKLKDTAMSDGVLVSGILFLTDMLVKENIVGMTEMAEKLERLLSINSRLPKSLFNERIAKYRKV